MLPWVIVPHCAFHYFCFIFWLYASSTNPRCFLESTLYITFFVPSTLASLLARHATRHLTHFHPLYFFPRLTPSVCPHVGTAVLKGLTYPAAYSTYLAFHSTPLVPPVCAACTVPRQHRWLALRSTTFCIPSRKLEMGFQGVKRLLPRY